MLDELRIQALGVIDDATMHFGPGLTVVTGETGAGKTMVVTGLQLLFGARADRAQVRTGSDQCAVDGRVTVAGAALARIAEAGAQLDEDDTLLLRRTVTSTGRSRAHAGGVSVPVGVLAELGDLVLAIHGQAGQMHLARPAEQRNALDRYAGVDLVDYRTGWRAWQEAEQRWQERVRDAASLAAEAEVLEHGLVEIERVAPQPGEDEELATIASRLAHVDALRTAARVAHDALVGSDDPAPDATDVLGLLGPAVQDLARAGSADPALDDLGARLRTLVAEVADLGADLAAYEAGLDADPDTLARVEQRRADLSALIRRFGRAVDPDGPTGVAAVLDWAKRAAARHAEIDVSDDALARLKEARDTARAAAARAAGALSAQRTEAAARLSAAVSAELAGLAMPGAELGVVVRHRPPSTGQPTLDLPGGQVGAGPEGVDEVTFELRTEPAAPAVALHRGASGGELSRVMLALEVILADTDPVPTMVFDEVDAGVGGRAAIEVGRRLARLARSRQVIVVTHLAQVAAYADRHLVVDRAAASGGITASEVQAVAAADREAELARMLGGLDSVTARRHAAELLAQAGSETG
ncbi:MAG TPA: DNA repair protein RecN [Jatrophihabitantaceae bacterium]|nr:DNA repair protein RecN [Jatrophihabitantaceae bacterium]